MAIVKDPNITEQLYSVYLYYLKNIDTSLSIPFEKIYIVDDIANDLNKIGFDNINNVQGGTVIPSRANGEFIIIIDVSGKNPLDSAGILIHELTHVSDFEKYINYYSNRKSRKRLLKMPCLSAYNMYSEFHASAFGEYYNVKWLSDTYHNNSAEIYAQSILDSLLLEYINKVKSVLSQPIINQYELSQLLGKFLISDIHHNIEDMHSSCIHQYAPMIFDEKKLFLVCQLYYLYADGLRNNHIFDNLKSAQKLLTRMSEEW